ncbi:hypothetical protein Poli38472_011026 [Pythium oligandrum]|uniref:Protein kinase domain-containing protein n=1 Tax=Pythium oligandrum TaxID=41045 RepID=A0A8K1CRM3_PYTOL|nr:hypothetical protein Poli38472_011026 [Pythium oligandrum]|eukprot:TMW67406.1 hypothetical protein Poli38472_011026 [Pythium oligandrum]
MPRRLGVALVLAWLGRMIHAADTLVCKHAALDGAMPAAWRVYCDDDPSKQITFDSTLVQSVTIGHDATVTVATATPTDVYASSAFDRIDSLVSDTIKTLDIHAEAKWMHKNPVTILPSAFIGLSALETLVLQDVPLASPVLHLQLPVSLRKLSLIGCGLQKFSFEFVGGGSPSALTEIDLHSNEIVQIPAALYALHAARIDLRLNKLAALTVSKQNQQILAGWLERGILEVDNIKQACSIGKTTQMQGVSQTFTVCVVDDNVLVDVDSSNSTSSNQSREDDTPSPTPDPAIVEPSEADNGAVNKLVDSSTPAPSPSKDDEAVSSSSGSRESLQTGLISAAAVIVVLVVVVIALIVVRRRNHKRNRGDSADSCGNTGKKRAPALLSNVTDDVNVDPDRGTNESASFDTALGDLPDFNQNGAIQRSSTSRYTTLTTPTGRVHRFMMSKSLQTLTGLSQFSIMSEETRTEQRRLNKDKLRVVLNGIAARGEAFEVNRIPLTIAGEVTENENGALQLQCHRASDSDTKLLVKIYVEQDIRLAIREYRALLVMQSQTCQHYISQMVATEMEKKVHGVKCAVIVVEMGSSTTFRHIVRGQVDRSQQFPMVQLLYRAVKAIECLHDRQFIHGGLHLDALVVHPGDDCLKLRSLEYATRFGDTIQGYNSAMLEYLPPEMDRHLIYSEQMTRPSSESVANVDDDEYQVLRASPTFDVWCVGIFILKMYANCKCLDEFNGCEDPMDYFLRATGPTFNLDHSLKLYVYHDDVRELATLCLHRDPRKRPKLSSVLNHRVFRAYDRLEEAAFATSYNSQRGLLRGKRELLPPSLWLFLPPAELGLVKTRSVEQWIQDLTTFQDEKRAVSTGRTPELMFPLLFLCEDSRNVSTTCSGTGFQRSRLSVPASLLSLVMPLVQESTLFLEAKSILSENPRLDIAEVSGLGKHQWDEVIKFYRALEVMLLAPISTFTLLILKPLDEMLATQDKEMARQVLDEVKCMIFNQEKRDHVLSLLDILSTIAANAPDESDVVVDVDVDEEVSDLEEAEHLEADERKMKKTWAGLRKLEVPYEAALNMPPIRWLCDCHVECEMEWHA